MYLLFRCAALAAAGLLFNSAWVKASPLTWGAEVNPSNCDAVGPPMINVHERVINSVDSGEGGNYWAFISYNRHLQVWAQSDGSFCAVVQYAGSFDGVGGQTSPGAGGTLSGDESGTFQGGYLARVSATPLASPTWRTRGFVGVHDHACDITGNCPGYINWVDQYFSSGWGSSYLWWGWTYHGGNDGSWINSVDGNSGDILDD